MLNRVGIVAVALVSAVGIAAMVDAGTPKKAKKFKGELITAYDACGSTPFVTTGVLALPACSAVESDPVCGFIPGDGAGKVDAGVTGTPDVKVKAKLGKLSAGCEGETLSVSAFIRVSTDACTSGGRCTTNGLTLPLGATCVVAGGKCAINTTVNTVIPGAITAGDALEVDLQQITLSRVTGPGAPVDTFVTGVFAP
jgi:hypothetical protein